MITVHSSKIMYFPWLDTVYSPLARIGVCRAPVPYCTRSVAGLTGKTLLYVGKGRDS